MSSDALIWASIKLAVVSVTAAITLRDPIRRQKDLSDSRFCVSHLTSSLLFIVVKHGSSRRPWWLQGNTVRLWSPLPCLSSVFLMILTIIFDDRSSSHDGRRSHLVSTYKSHLPTTIGGIRTPLCRGERRLDAAGVPLDSS